MGSVIVGAELRDSKRPQAICPFLLMEKHILQLETKVSRLEMTVSTPAKVMDA
jgi:hypothetical protein